MLIKCKGHFCCGPGLSRFGEEGCKKGRKGVKLWRLVNTIMAKPGTKVYVGDLGSGGSKPELEREFEKFGVLRSVWVARNPPGNQKTSCM